MLRRSKRPLIARALLALALLVAQGGAQAHAYTHGQTDPARAPSTQVCDECLCYMPVKAGAGGAQHTVVVARAEVAPIVSPPVAAAPSTRPFSAFRSRAPPASS